MKNDRDYTSFFPLILIIFAIVFVSIILIFMGIALSNAVKEPSGSEICRHTCKSSGGDMLSYVEQRQGFIRGSTPSSCSCLINGQVIKS